MRILAAHYVSGKTFLNDYREEVPPARLLYRTKVDVLSGEEVLLEIRFPELPSRVLLHANVLERDDDKGGVWLAFADEDRPTREFVVAAAEGDDEARAAPARKNPRFPVELHTDIQPEGEGPLTGATEDLSAGGAFVRANNPPPVGTPVALVLTPPGHDALTVPGVVAWIRDADEPGFGIRFDHPEPEEGRRLRELLRRIQETGTLAKGASR